MRTTARRCLTAATLEASPAGTPPGGTLRARAAFPADLEVFQGHFPGAPLVPGVLLIEALRAACERVLGAPLAIRAIDEARFTGQVEPERSVSLEAQLAELEGAATGGPPAPARPTAGGAGWLCRGTLRLVGDGEDGGDAGEVARLRLTLVREEDG